MIMPRWPWSKRREERLRALHERLPSEEYDRQAVRRARSDLRQAQLLHRESVQISEKVREHARRNHWAEAIRQALAGEER